MPTRPFDYPDNAFDYVILSQTLQATRQPRAVADMLRIGRHAIVSFPNFGHWRIRFQVAIGGHMPLTRNLSCAWYDTPNIHFCTIQDFIALAREIDARIERGVALDYSGAPLRYSEPWIWNFFGEQGVFRLTRKRKSQAGRHVLRNFDHRLCRDHRQRRIVQPNIFARVMPFGPFGPVSA
jgi:methionine biosynthesis protein MetW